MLPDEEFLAWFFTYFADGGNCPHCGGLIDESDINDIGETVECPHCGREITEDDM